MLSGRDGYEVTGGSATLGGEDLLDKFLEDGELSEDEIRKGLRALTLSGDIVVTMCGSAFKNKGVQAMLDAVIDFMPSPVDVPAIKGHLDDDTEGDDDEPNIVAGQDCQCRAGGPGVPGAVASSGCVSSGAATAASPSVDAYLWFWWMSFTAPQSLTT